MPPQAPAPPPRARPALAVLALLLIAAAALAPRATREMPDFEVYHLAGARAAAAEPLYRPDDGHFQFKYLPAFAVVARPLALLPLSAAKAVWLFASVVLLWAFVCLSIRLLPECRRPAWLLALAAGVLMGKFYAHELVLGQVNALLGATVLAAVAAPQRGRAAISGLLVAFASVVKPYAVLFVPWLAIARGPGAVVAATIGLAAALALPAIAYGVRGTIDLHAAWWRTVTETTAPNLLNQDNVSVAAMYAKWLGIGGSASALAAVTSVALIAAAALAIARRAMVREPSPLEAAMLLTLLPLLSPQGWDYVFMLATPAIVLLTNYGDLLPRWLQALTIAAAAIAGLTLFDVMGREVYGAFMRTSVVTVCFLAIVGALLALRLRRIA